MYTFQSVSLDITYKCNLRCKHCFNSSGEFLGGELNDSQILKIIDEISKYQVESICLCGGEPFYRFDLLLSVAKLIKKNSPKTFISMVSNGILWTNKKAKELSEAGLDVVQFSLDGFTNESYDFVRQSHGKLSKVFDAIKYAQDAGLDVMLSSLPHKKNFNQIQSMIEFCIANNIVEFRMQPLMPLGRGDLNFNELCLSDSEYQQVQSILKTNTGRMTYSGQELKIEWGDPMDHFFMLQEVPYISSLNISAYGDITISPYLPFSIWNLSKSTFASFIENQIPERALLNSRVIQTINEMMTVNDLAVMSHRMNKIENISNREALDISKEIICEERVG
ncbi:radical SAM protein [Enterococcus devriesei]|uniref:radical SAM protein n=1 Tax=Enterococcus devriesei TaxID=319970 RepID=UPI0036D3E054